MQDLQHHRLNGGKILRLLNPWRWPGQPSPGLATRQLLHNKINDINMKPELQFGHRLMMILVCHRPGNISGNLGTAILKSHPQNRHAAWGPFPTGIPDVL